MSAHKLPRIHGTATLNDKGQLVIPAEARAQLGLKPGSKVVIMSSERKPVLILLKAEEVEAVLQHFTDALNSKNNN